MNTDKGIQGRLLPARFFQQVKCVIIVRPLMFRTTTQYHNRSVKIGYLDGDLLQQSMY